MREPNEPNNSNRKEDGAKPAWEVKGKQGSSAAAWSATEWRNVNGRESPPLTRPAGRYERKGTNDGDDN